MQITQNVCVFYILKYYSIIMKRRFSIFFRFYFYCTMIGAKFHTFSLSSLYLPAFVQIEILQRATISIILCVCVFVENGSNFYNFLSHNSHFLFSSNKSNSKNKIEIGQWFVVIYFKENEFFFFGFCGFLHQILHQLWHLHLNLFLC